jgi:hypothetical protein
MKLHENKKANRRISNNEYRMSKEGILSILSKKIERSDIHNSSIVTRHSINQSFFFDQAGHSGGRRLG